MEKHKHNIKVGDKVRYLPARRNGETSDTLYTVVEILVLTDKYMIKVKHPDIGGHFTFDVENIGEVISEIR